MVQDGGEEHRGAALEQRPQGGCVGGALRRFPPENKMSDVGTDSRFLKSAALHAAASDQDYRAFLGWVLKTCAAAH